MNKITGRRLHYPAVFSFSFQQDLGGTILMGTILMGTILMGIIVMGFSHGKSFFDILHNLGDLHHRGGLHYPLKL